MMNESLALEKLAQFITIQVEIDLILAAALGKETEQKVAKVLTQKLMFSPSVESKNK